MSFKSKCYDIVYPKGTIVILDHGFNNSSEVEVISQTEPRQLHTFVKNIGDKDEEGWKVMSYRLTPKTTDHARKEIHTHQDKNK
jgi:hypothetical protein